MSLCDQTLTRFLERLGSGDPTPGGGSVAALCGALGAALAAMVSRLTLGRKTYQTAWEAMEDVRQKSEHLAGRFQALVEEDTLAYEAVMEAVKRPRENEKQKQERQEALQNALKKAALVPLETLRASAELVETAVIALKKGNPNALTDAGVAVQLARAAALSAAYNVNVNLAGLTDEAFSTRTAKDVQALLETILTRSAEAEKAVLDRLGSLKKGPKSVL